MTGPATTEGVSKRSVMIAGHRTSVSLEDPFWTALRDIAAARGESVQALIGAIDAGRGGQNLSSAIRVHVLAAVRAGMREEARPSGPGADVTFADADAIVGRS